MLYIVSPELKAGPTPEEAVERLRREPLAALYAAGQKRITRKLQAARTLRRSVPVLAVDVTRAVSLGHPEAVLPLPVEL